MRLFFLRRIIGHVPICQKRRPLFLQDFPLKCHVGPAYFPRNVRLFPVFVIRHRRARGRRNARRCRQHIKNAGEVAGDEQIVAARSHVFGGQDDFKLVQDFSKKKRGVIGVSAADAERRLQPADFLRALRDDVHHADERICPVYRGSRAANHLNPAHVEEGHVIIISGCAAEERIVQRVSVNQDFHAGRAVRRIFHA